MSNIEITDYDRRRITDVPGYEDGIDVKKLSSALPYMYTDTPKQIVMLADIGIIDQIIDWFGKDVVISKIPNDPDKVKVVVNASPNAMEHWALQYIRFVEVLSPESLREQIREAIDEGYKKYK